MMFIPKSEFRGLGAVAEAPGFRLFPSSKMDAGRISVTAAHQLRGQFNGRKPPFPGALTWARFRTGCPPRQQAAPRDLGTNAEMTRALNPDRLGTGAQRLVGIFGAAAGHGIVAPWSVTQCAKFERSFVCGSSVA